MIEDPSLVRDMDRCDPLSDGGPPMFLPSITQLRSFVEAARAGSISRASAELRRSQSAVTQAIQNLEAEIGTTLFERTNTGSYLTETGEILARRAERCFARIEGALATLLGEQEQARIQLIARRLTKAQIVTLTVVHECGSFSQAARQVDVSLTSVHRSARSLEKQLGRELFVNTAQGVAPNKAGERLSNELRLALRELEWAAEEMRAQEGALAGRLLVGSLLLAGNAYIASCLERFCTLHPQVQVSLIHGPYEELLPRLRGGSLDFLAGLLRDPPPVDDVVEEAMEEDPYVVVVRRDHPLTRRPVTMEDLRAADWIAPRRGTSRRTVFNRMFPPRQPPRYSIEGYSLLTNFILLLNSDRLALMTRSELEVDHRLGGKMVALETPLDEPPVVIGITTRLKWEPTPLQHSFLDFLRAQRTGRAG